MEKLIDQLTWATGSEIYWLDRDIQAVHCHLVCCLTNLIKDCIKENESLNTRYMYKYSQTFHKQKS